LFFGLLVCVIRGSGFRAARVDLLEATVRCGACRKPELGQKNIWIIFCGGVIERVHDHNHAIATGRWQLVHRAQRFRDSGLSPEGEPPPRVCLRTGSGDSYGSQPHVLGTFHPGCRNQHCSVRLPVLTLRYAQIWHCQRKHNRDYDGRHCFQSHRIPP
jgi:hypothetical protein